MKIDFKKQIFWIFIIASLIPFVFIFLNATNNLISKIEELAGLNWELDEEIVHGLSFELAKRQPLIGTSEKYVLLDEEGSAWLFKLHESPTSFYCKIEESVSRCGRMCGLNLPYVHSVTLPINGRMVQGTIQRMIPDATTLHGFDISKLKSAQLSELLKQQVLDYFVDNYGTSGDNFLLSVKTHKIYGVDKDSSFDANEKLIRANDNIRRFTGEGIYSDIWNRYIKGELDIDIGPGLAVADFMSGISDKTVFEIFNYILDEPKEVTFSSIGVLQDKKNSLFKDFIGFYEMMSQKSGRALKILNKNELSLYQRRLFKKLKTENRDKRLWHKRLSTRAVREQKDIKIVSSEDAWLLIEDKIFNPYCRNSVLGKENYAEAVRGLRDLRDVSKSIAEKIAITIYILRVNELFLTGSYNFADPFFLAKLRVTFYPELIDINSLKDRYSKVIGKGIFQDMEAEFYYAMALTYLLQGQDEKAYHYALKCQEKGFELKDIWEKKP